MNTQVAATKGNLLALKKSLELAKMGFDLMDKKRNILIREMMMLISKASEIQEKIDTVYAKAYEALQTANVTNGMCNELSKTIEEENDISLTSRSVMGVEIPIVTMHKENDELKPFFGFYQSTSAFDEAYLRFDEVKKLTIEMAEIETSVYRLADAIKKTQKRANALKNIMIPKFSEGVKNISASLEEKSREQFSTMKIIKRQKEKK